MEQFENYNAFTYWSHLGLILNRRPHVYHLHSGYLFLWKRNALCLLPRKCSMLFSVIFWREFRVRYLKLIRLQEMYGCLGYPSEQSHKENGRNHQIHRLVGIIEIFAQQKCHNWSNVHEWVEYRHQCAADAVKSWPFNKFHRILLFACPRTHPSLHISVANIAVRVITPADTKPARAREAYK